MSSFAQPVVDRPIRLMRPIVLKRGDQYFKSGLYREALVEYTMLLSVSLDYLTLANRSHCYASLGELDQAIVDARMSLALTPHTHTSSKPNPKGSYRLARALSLKDPVDVDPVYVEEALRVCDEALGESPGDKVRNY
jgi:tetratricopeptide (TPR) repeat protein